MKNIILPDTKVKYNSLLINKQQYVIPQDSNCINLSVIQFHEQHSAVVKNVLNNKQIDINYYPDTSDDFYKLFTSTLANHLGVDKKNMIITNGSDCALNLIINAFVISSSRVCIPIPNYPHFESFIELTPTASISKPTITTEQEALDYNYLNYDCVYFSSPNLPLGYTLRHNTVIKLLTKYPNTLFIIDGAYIEYSDVDRYHEMSTKYNNMIATFTFSKAYGLAGMRIGGLTACDELINIMTPLVNTKSVTRQAMLLAHACLCDNEYYMQKVSHVKQIKKLTDKTLSDICLYNGIIYDYMIPEGGNFFLIKTRHPEYVCKEFKNHGILVRDKSKEIVDSIRICIATAEIMHIVFNIIKFINLPALIKSQPVIFDLDGTLRDGVSDYYEISDKMNDINPNSIILTNNAFIDKHVLFNLPVYRSVDLAIDRLQRKQVGIIKRVSQHKTFYDCDAIILDTNKLTTDIIVKIIDSCNPVYVTDGGLCTRVRGSAEYSGHYHSDSIIPDTGLFAGMLKQCRATVVDYTKQVLFKNSKYNKKCYKFVVGDTDSDKQLALNNNIDYVKVGCSTNKYDIATNTFNFINIEHLLVC